MFVIPGDPQHIEERKKEAMQLRRENIKKMPMQRLKDFLFKKLKKKH